MSESETQDLILKVLRDRALTFSELATVADWLGTDEAFRTRLAHNLVVMAQRGLLVKIRGGKGDNRYRYTVAEYLMGFTDKDVAADYAEERGDAAKAALLRAARSVQYGKDQS